MAHSILAICGAVGIVAWPAAGAAQTRHYPLESTVGLHVLNVLAQPAVHDGKPGLRVVADSVAISRLPMQANQSGPDLIAWIDGPRFANGTIEAEIAGAPAPGADTSARGFVGIAFRVQDDRKTYDAFYLRPTNGRAADPVRRGHATQYVSHPDWPWFRLRRETPSKYESYADLVPDAWTRVRIEVHGTRARLFVNDQAQPTLVVNDLKTGATATGAVALWIGPGTIAHFRNLTVTPAP
jgi:hypothetical protein